MTLRIDHDSIARAMRDAAAKARHGTREEQSGRFLAAVSTGPRELQPATPSPRAAEARPKGRMKG